MEAESHYKLPEITGASVIKINEYANSPLHSKDFGYKLNQTMFNTQSKLFHSTDRSMSELNPDFLNDTSSAEGSPQRYQKKKPRYLNKTIMDKRKSPMLSVNDVVNGIINKPEFGHSFYKTPSNEMLMKKIPFGHSQKYKHFTFGAQVMKDKAWVPSPSLYKLDYNWNNMLPKDNGKFKIDKR